MTEFNNKENYLKISDINTKIQDSISSKLGSFKFWIQAEIAGFKVTNGHCYLNLIEKQQNATSPKASIKGMIWSNNFLILNTEFNRVVGLELKENIKILFLATVNYHINFGLSLTIEDIEPVYTLGTILQERDSIVKRLKEEGHYYLNKRTKFPIVPQRIAVISAQDSKGYEDFLNKLQLNSYNYKYSISLFQSLLQGDKAAENIKQKLLEIYNKLNLFDIVVIVRGGGGAVNLNCFNNYALSKAVARFPIPVITGIGHTTNVSIIDEVAYLDKITPTDVADFIIEQTYSYDKRVQDKFKDIIHRYNELKNLKLHQIDIKSTNLVHFFKSIMNKKSNVMSNLNLRINQSTSSFLKDKIGVNKNIKDIFIKEAINQLGNKKSELKSNLVTLNRVVNYQISKGKEVLKNCYSNLSLNCKNFVRTEIQKQDGISKTIGYLDPKNILKRGYSITLKNGKAITQSTSLNIDDTVTTLFFEGDIESKIINKKN